MATSVLVVFFLDPPGFGCAHILDPCDTFDFEVYLDFVFHAPCVSLTTADIRNKHHSIKIPMFGHPNICRISIV